MADVMRWKHGDTNPVVANVRSSEDIEIGDLLFMERTDGFARPFSTLVDLGSLGGNQAYVACRFLGVAAQRHRPSASADPDDPVKIRVDTSGVFEYACAALGAALYIGQFLAADENAAGTALLDQQVEAVNIVHPDRAIARLAKEAIAGDTVMLVKIRSNIMDGDFADECIATSSSSSGAGPSSSPSPEVASSSSSSGEGVPAMSSSSSSGEDVADPRASSSSSGEDVAESSSSSGEDAVASSSSSSGEDAVTSSSSSSSSSGEDVAEPSPSSSSSSGG